ncbi:SelT/SelW/SelH family protein [Cellulosimicrobium funkei]|uniref:SelT/SelW/SelH family protein n=1 Tax=Cellulosimicrobium funkei TaxID=264251 RepID=A0A4Y8R0M6_9MICO|nr:SelT/SelW/SelH family protein [Cellulosimicrobium funkei]TFF08637.1 SelT/SelW/SelH family protein [Cellulosimicrobium funkei]TGA73029.1 SelT/SelW/SelH family protein [Cellulosimicrobium terreum]
MLAFLVVGDPGVGDHLREHSQTLHHCWQCRWLLRAAWVAQELLQTFRTRLGEVALVPGTDGVFRVTLDAGDGPVLLWDRRVDGGFPEIPDLKRRVRDAVAPDLSLGHTDRAATTTDPATDPATRTD